MIYGQQPSASTQCMPGGNKVCNHMNDNSKGEIKSLVIGTHPSALPIRTLKEEPYTYVCKGEGPETITGLLDHLKYSKTKLDQIPGLYYFDQDTDEPKFNQPAKMFSNLDEDLKGQAWHLVDMDKYKAHNWHAFGRLNSRDKYASLQTSLGCPFKCTFCCINAPFERNTMRTWSPEHVIKEIDLLVNNYGITNIKIPDEMFVLNPKQVTGICDKIIDRGYGDKLNFWAYARIDTLEDNEMLKKMIKAGIKWLGLGIESGSKHVRDGVIKGRFDNYNIDDIVKKVRDFGFYVGANYIFGLPDDDLNTMNETLELSLRMNTEYANFYSAMAYPGSQLYTIAKENKWLTPDDEGGPGWIGFSQHAYETLPLRTEKIKASEVLTFRDNAFNTYFNSSEYLSLIKNTFGEDTLDHVKSMSEHKLIRKHHEVEVNY